MGCSNRSLNNLDTTIYRTGSGSSCGDNSTVTIQFVDGAMPYCHGNNSQPSFRPPMNFPPQFPPQPPMPPMPPIPPVTNPTSTYALFYNASATGATYAAGTNIPFPSTLYDTSSVTSFGNNNGIPNNFGIPNNNNMANNNGITNNNGVITLEGGPRGRAYLVNYQVTGIFTTAQLGIAVNGTVDTNSITSATGDDADTVSGSYIVTVPANTISTIAVNVVSGTVATGTPTTGTNISIVRIY